MSLAGILVELRDELSTRMQDRWGGALASLAARAADVLAMYKAHIGNDGGLWHSEADEDNDLLATAPVTREQCYALLNRLRVSIPAHFATTGDVHLVADSGVVISPEADDNDSGVELANELADLLDAHRTSPGVHALDDTVNAITSDPAHTGTLGDSGGSRPVEIGDRHLPDNNHGHPFVVLAWAGGRSTGPRDMNTNPKVISQRDNTVEIHCWVAEAESEPDYRVRDVQRIEDAEALLDDIECSVYVLQHGALGRSTQPFSDLEIVRDHELMKFGEECIALMVVPKPVTLGPTYLTALGEATAATPGGLVVNPPIS